MAWPINNSNSGVLFANKKRGGNDPAPNMKGNGPVTIKGVEYNLELAAWTRQSKKTGKFLRLSIKPAASGVEHSRRSPDRPQDEEDEQL